MRPVNKGNAPRQYDSYGEARHDLAERIGYYCSYCEMPVKNSIEVEHILPVNQGGNRVDWNNFLLSCKYCNTIKSDNNDNLDNYLWPDRDNTDLAFEYYEMGVIAPKDNLNNNLSILAQNTINLTGLDRIPGGINIPTEADTRWRSRKEVWDIANKSLENWHKAPISEMADQIAKTSKLSGHYSIWCKVFESVTEVLAEIDNVYRQYGLFKEYEDDNITRKIRINGRI